MHFALQITAVRQSEICRESVPEFTELQSDQKTAGYVVLIQKQQLSYMLYVTAVIQLIFFNLSRRRAPAHFQFPAHVLLGNISGFSLSVQLPG